MCMYEKSLCRSLIIFRSELNHFIFPCVIVRSGLFRPGLRLTSQDVHGTLPSSLREAVPTAEERLLEEWGPGCACACGGGRGRASFIFFHLFLLLSFRLPRTPSLTAFMVSLPSKAF